MLDIGSEKCTERIYTVEISRNVLTHVCWRLSQEKMTIAEEQKKATRIAEESGRKADDDDDGLRMMMNENDD